MNLAAERRKDAAQEDAGQSENQPGDDIISKLAGNRSQRIVWDRLIEVVSKPLLIKSDPTPVRARQMSPQRSNYWRWKRNRTKSSEFDPKVHTLPYNRENPLLSGMLCKDFPQGGQC
jgi:hypothetical protein